MFNSIREKVMRETVLSERIRTIFFLSRHLKKPISVLLIKPHQKIDQAVIVNGVITSIINGTLGAKGEHHKYMGGEFSLGIKDSKGLEIRFNFSDVYAISIRYENDPKVFLNRKNTVNVTQHLQSFTGFGPSSDSNESHYYHILSLFIDM
jgi:hypothetical protein